MGRESGRGKRKDQDDPPLTPAQQRKANALRAKLNRGKAYKDDADSGVYKHTEEKCNIRGCNKKHTRRHIKGGD